MSSNVKIGADSDGDVVADAVASNYKQIKTNAWSMQFSLCVAPFCVPRFVCGQKWMSWNLRIKTNIEFKAKGADLMKLPGASRGLVRVSSQRRFQNGNEDDVMTFPTAAKNTSGAQSMPLFWACWRFSVKRRNKNISTSVSYSAFLNVRHLRRNRQAHLTCVAKHRVGALNAHVSEHFGQVGVCVFAFGQRVKLDEIAECRF